jgi:Na+/alanine symporter
MSDDVGDHVWLNQSGKISLDIGDLGVGLMAWFNNLQLHSITKPALAALKIMRNRKEERSTFNRRY